MISTSLASLTGWLLFSHPPAPDSPVIATAASLLHIGLGAAIVYHHGWHKLADGLAWRSKHNTGWAFAEEIRAAGFPLPVFNAVLATAVQLGAGLGLILGLFTRPCALALAATLLGAVYTNAVLKKSQQLAGLYLLLIAAVLLLGPGRLALDSMIFPASPPISDVFRIGGPDFTPPC
jgi:putative oxidoreductase